MSENHTGFLGTSVCNGDSGGSMAFEKNGLYHIRGIVSVTVSREDNQRLCDPNHYVIFTDVAQYLPWIEDVAQFNLQASQGNYIYVYVTILLYLFRYSLHLHPN